MEIKVEQDNIKAHITTQNPQVQEILDKHMPRLREALEQQGMNLEHLQVTVAGEGESEAQLFQEHLNQQHLSSSRHSNRLNTTFTPELELEEDEEPIEQQNLSVLV